MPFKQIATDRKNREIDHCCFIMLELDVRYVGLTVIGQYNCNTTTRLLAKIEVDYLQNVV